MPKSTLYQDRPCEPIKTPTRWWAVIGVILLSACASSPTVKQTAVSTDSVIELNPDQEKVSSQSDSAQDPNLPKLDLDADTLANLLIVNLASYQGQWAIAAKKAQQAALATKDHRLARLATLLALRDDDYQQGLVSAELWHELSADEADPLNMLMITQLGSGDVEGMKRSIDKHAKSKEIDEHIKQIAALLTRQKNQQAAIETASYLVGLYAESAQAALSSAYVAEFFSEFEQSETWVRKALNLRPGWELAAQMKAKLLASQGKDEERGAFIKQYVQAHPESIMMRINFAAEMVRKNQIDAAYEYVQTLLQDAPRDVDVLQYAGALAEDRKDYEQAAQYYQRGLNIDRGNDRMRWALARRHLIEKKYRSAERHFADITDPELVFAAQVQMANARYELYGLDEAVNTLAGLEATTEAQFINLALTRHYFLMAEYQYEEALGAINEILYYLPDNLELKYARALVAAELNRLDIAEPDLRAIIKAEPEHANALNALGYTLVDQTDRLDEARELIEKAHELRPNDAHILDSMGWVAYRQQDYANAIKYLEQAYAISEEVEIATHLAEVLWEKGDQARATEIWLSWVVRDGNNRLLVDTMQRYGVSIDDNVGVNGRQREPEHGT